MRKPTRPDPPPHILDYLARVKVEGINVTISLHERMDLWVKTGSLVR